MEWPTKATHTSAGLLAGELIEQIGGADATVVERRLVDGIPHLSVAATAALTAAPDARSDEVKPILEVGDALITDLAA